MYGIIFEADDKFCELSFKNQEDFRECVINFGKFFQEFGVDRFFVIVQEMVKEHGMRSEDQSS